MEKVNQSSSIPPRARQEPLKKLLHQPRIFLKKTADFFENWIAWTYGQPGKTWQPAALQFLSFVNAALRLANKSFNGHIYLCKGISKISGEPLTVQFIGEWKIGEDNSLAYFEQLFFEPGNIERCDMGKCSPGSMSQIAREMGEQVDLIAVLANPLLLWEPPSGDWVISPPDVRMVYDFPPGANWDQIENHLRGQQEYNLRILRRSGITSRSSRSEKDLQLFYERMYLPFVTNRYKEHVDGVGYPFVHKIFKKSGGSVLLFENSAGEPIAGGLEKIDQGVLYAVINGVMDGDYAWVKKGAMTAWYYYEIKRAFELGCRRYDAGLARPFVNNGLYIHKHRWGLKPERDYWKPQQVLLWAPNSTPAALAWLKAYMFLPQFAHSGGPTLHAEYQKLKQEHAQ